MKYIIESEPANPDIANAFFRAGYIEVWGRSTLNIIDYCKEAGLPEPDFSYDSGVTTIFRTGDIGKDLGKDTIKDTVKDTINKLSKSEEKIFELIKKKRINQTKNETN